MDDVIFNGHLVGTFYGYRGGNVYRLSDGSKWVQDDGTDEPVFREYPAARLMHLHDRSFVYLDVEGTSSVVRVIRCGAHPTPHRGAY